jgi:hypothetical protein
MPKRADATSMNALWTELQNLKTLYNTMVLQGDREVADAVQRAMRELMHVSVTGPASQVGVTFDASRP